MTQHLAELIVSFKGEQKICLRKKGSDRPAWFCELLDEAAKKLKVGISLLQDVCTLRNRVTPAKQHPDWHSSEFQCRNKASANYGWCVTYRCTKEKK